MLDLNFFLISEIVSLVAFSIILGREIYNRNASHILQIISALVFGMLLEIGNIYLAGTYSYGNEFALMIRGVPLAIGLSWAVIIFSAMRLSDSYEIPETVRPFMDALIALVLDFSSDPIAVRLGLWKWAIPLNEEWFGVPFENFVGWAVAVLSFSCLMRFIRRLDFEKLSTRILMLFSPLVSYAGLLVGLLSFGLIIMTPYQLNHWGVWVITKYHFDFSLLYHQEVRSWKIAISITLFAFLVYTVGKAIVNASHRGRRILDTTSFVALSILHLFPLFTVFASGIYREIPALAISTIGMFMAHLVLWLFGVSWGKQSGHVFFSRDRKG